MSANVWTEVVPAGGAGGRCRRRPGLTAAVRPRRPRCSGPGKPWRARRAITKATTALAAALGAALAPPAEGLEVVGLTCEGQVAPTGVGLAPALGWQLVGEPGRRGIFQEAYRVVVARRREAAAAGRGDLWDSGRVVSGRSQHVAYGGRPVGGGGRAWWAVEVWAGGGPDPVRSAPSWWEAGLSGPELRGHWVGPGPTGSVRNTPRAPVRLRRVFELPAGAARARAFVCGLGAYRLRINGRRVGEDHLTPGCTQFGLRAQYQTYDVTPLLQAGDNAVGVTLGNGWWSSGLGPGFRQYFPPPGEHLRLWLQLEITGEDGARHTVTTGPGWRWAPAPTTYSTLYDGESYDARRETPGWDRTGFDDAAWPEVAVGGKPRRADPEGDRERARAAMAMGATEVAGERGRYRYAAADIAAALTPAEPPLVPQRQPPVRVAGETPAVAMEEPRPGVWVFDFGRHHTGFCRLAVKAPRGTEVVVRYADEVDRFGRLRTRTNGGARNTDTYTCRGGGEVERWEPLFTFRGYRYAELSGLPGRPPEDALVSREIGTAAAGAGTFACSDATVNEIQANIVRTLRANLVSVPLDSPGGETRMGWCGYPLAAAEASCWNLDLTAVYPKFLADLADTERPGGEPSDYAPAPFFAPATPGLADVVADLPWVHYQFYGDRRVLEAAYPSMVRYAAYLRHASEGGLYRRDVAGGEPGASARGRPPRGYYGAAFGVRSLARLAAAAEVLGKGADAERYGRLAAASRAAFNAAFFDRRRRAYPGTGPSAATLPLALEIAAPERRAGVAAGLASGIASNGYRLDSGLFGTRWVLPVLSLAGHHETAWRAVSTVAEPSLGAQVKAGATTLWETWSGGTAAGHSVNHPALAGVGAWFYEHLAGLSPDPAAPGFSRFTVRPRPAKNLLFVRARYRSPHGDIAVEWTHLGGRFELALTVPGNTAATVVVPADDPATVGEGGLPAAGADGVEPAGALPGAAVFNVGSGAYRFSSRLGD